jgi:hypothetical protein
MEILRALNELLWLFLEEELLCFDELDSPPFIFSATKALLDFETLPTASMVLNLVLSGSSCGVSPETPPFSYFDPAAFAVT